MYVKMYKVFIARWESHDQEGRVGRDEAHMAQEVYFDIPVPSGVLPIVFLTFSDSSNLLPSPRMSSRAHWVGIEGDSLRAEPRFLREAPCRSSREPSKFMTPRRIAGLSMRTTRTIQSRKSFVRLSERRKHSPIFVVMIFPLLSQCQFMGRCRAYPEDGGLFQGAAGGEVAKKPSRQHAPLALERL